MAIVVLETVCCSHFAAITSHEQRAQYKEEFNTDYVKYKELKTKNDQVTEEFNMLKAQLANYPKGSDEYKVCHIPLNFH